MLLQCYDFFLVRGVVLVVVVNVLNLEESSTSVTMGTQDDMKGSIMMTRVLEFSSFSIVLGPLSSKFVVIVVVGETFQFVRSLEFVGLFTHD